MWHIRQTGLDIQVHILKNNHVVATSLGSEWGNGRGALVLQTCEPLPVNNPAAHQDLARRPSTASAGRHLTEGPPPDESYCMAACMSKGS